MALERRVLLGLGLGLAALPVVAGAAEAVRLELRPSDGPVVYRVRTRDETTSKGGPRTADMVYEVTEELEKRVVPKGDGLLVMLRSRDKRIKVNGKVLPQLRLDPKPTFREVDRRGRPRRAGPARSPGEDLFPVLPDRPVAPGYSWRTRAEGTPAFSVPVRLEHTFEGMRVVDGERCAILETRGAAKGVDARSGVKLSFRVISNLALGESGQIVRSRSRSALTMLYPEPLPNGQRVIRKKSRRVVERVR